MPKCESLKITRIGQSATKPRREERSTTILQRSRQQAIGCRSGVRLFKDEDIVSSI